MENGKSARLASAAQNIDRMRSAIANNELSDIQVNSDAGKTALAALLAAAGSGEFDPVEAKETIKATMGLK